MGILTSLSLIANPINVGNINTSFVASAEEGISAYASSVFVCYSGTVTTTACYADADLCYYGDLTISTILQKKNIFGSWYDYKDDDPGKTYINVAGAYHSYPYTITSSGSYRCKYTVTATVNGITESRTTYSNVLTV